MRPSEPGHMISVGLMFMLPLLLVVPNLAMSVAAAMPWASAIANVALPLGVYLMLMAWSANAGRSALLMVPLSVLAAFQIVLLGLYLDGSVIAVDMFLNVVTTNSTEVGELLGNLAAPLAFVIVLYLPPIEAGMVAWWRRQRSPMRFRRLALKIGAAFMGVGFAFMIVASVTVPRYRATNEVFPLNAICNLVEAVSRTKHTAAYADTSRGFTFNAGSTDPLDGRRQIYLAVVGETSRADHYQVCGYDRFTTPRLGSVDSLICCRKVLSESNTTHKSVPMLLSTVDATAFGDSIYSHKSVITAFREAGFHTVFLSMQAHNKSFIDFFGAEADTTLFLREGPDGMPREGVYDTDILPVVDSLIAADSSPRLLIVLHLYGSHFNYVDRYPRSEAYFLPDKATEAIAENRDQLINAYDNSIRATDAVLHSLIERLDSTDCIGGLIYTSDHGEDIFDDDRGRFLHASPTATFAQLHVPLILYFNRQWRAAHPDRWHSVHRSCDCEISSSESYTPTLMHMAGVTSPRLDLHNALTSGSFRPVEQRLFVNDRNEAVDLHAAGFRPQDFAAMRAAGLAIH